MKTTIKNEKIDWMNEFNVYAMNRDSRLFQSVSDGQGLTIEIFPEENEDEVANRLAEWAGQGYEDAFNLYSTDHRLVGFAYYDSLEKYTFYYVQREVIDNDFNVLESTDLMSTRDYDTAVSYAKRYIANGWPLEENEQIVVQAVECTGLEEDWSGAELLWASKGTTKKNAPVPEGMECPYCQSKSISRAEDGRYHCNECDHLFDEDDIEREGIRHEMSALLSGTSEEHPRECYTTIGEEEAQGLSSLEMLVCDRCFQFEDGTIWLHIYGSNVNGDGYTNFDLFRTSDLRAVLEALRNE